MNHVLALNAAFRPTGWLTVEQAVKHYAEDQVLSELGSTGFLLRGGTGRNGYQSRILVSSIIAISGKVLPWNNDSFKLPKRGNRILFLRDRHICAYCGNVFHSVDLEREHVIPRAQKGKDVWENVVSACSGCNGKKSARTPEQANMPLLYLPYAPSPYEYMIMQGRNVLADQMDFLMQNVPKSSRLL